MCAKPLCNKLLVFHRATSATPVSQPLRFRQQHLLRRMTIEWPYRNHTVERRFLYKRINWFRMNITENRIPSLPATLSGKNGTGDGMKQIPSLLDDVYITAICRYRRHS